MEPDHKAQREPIEIPPEFTQGRETSRDPSMRQRYRRATVRDVGPFCRATAGHVVWRGVPSWHQQRTPSPDAQAFHRTKSPPWIRKRKARAKAQLQKASRKLNRG